MESSENWSYQDVVIRKRIVSGMVCASDLWKAAGNPSSLRPDKWFRSDSVQKRLMNLSPIVKEQVKKDDKGKIFCLPGVLDVVRGGQSQQGTFLSYDLAIDYTQMLSSDLHKWFTDKLSSSGDQKESKESTDPLSISINDFNGQVRITPKGLISIYDAIGFTTGHGNPRQVWNDLTARFPEVVQKTDNFQFQGQGQRETPVATLQVFLEILVTLPGPIAATVRAKSIDTMIRAMKGDLSLVEEILERIQNPQKLKDLENMIRSRRIEYYGDSPPYGTLDNPLTSSSITPEIKSGYGWVNRAEEMTNLLVDLATHVGDMVIDRDSPHRSYSSTSKNIRSRRIPLILRSLNSLEGVNIYHFETSYIDDIDVVEFCSVRSYPELAYRDLANKGVRYVIANIVSPCGITVEGVERLKECQETFDGKLGKEIIHLNAIRLDELVWGQMYPLIAERYLDADGKFGWHNLNQRIKEICKKLCQQTTLPKSLPIAKSTPQQLTLFDLLAL